MFGNNNGKDGGDSRQRGTPYRCVEQGHAETQRLVILTSSWSLGSSVHRLSNSKAGSILADCQSIKAVTTVGSSTETNMLRLCISGWSSVGLPASRIHKSLTKASRTRRPSGVLHTPADRLDTTLLRHLQMEWMATVIKPVSRRPATYAVRSSPFMVDDDLLDNLYWIGRLTRAVIWLHQTVLVISLLLSQ